LDNARARRPGEKAQGGQFGAGCPAESSNYRRLLELVEKLEGGGGEEGLPSGTGGKNAGQPLSEVENQMARRAIQGQRKISRES